jgi:hypothetical protein
MKFLIVPIAKAEGSPYLSSDTVVNTVTNLKLFGIRIGCESAVKYTQRHVVVVWNPVEILHCRGIVALLKD